MPVPPGKTRRPHLRGATRRWAVGGIALLATTGVLVGCSTGGGTKYVSLGDSYTAGPLIPKQQPDPLGCLRSDHDYPHLTATALHLSLTDASCSGAETKDMTSAQSVPLGGTNPPQFDAIDKSTKVVSLGIGGNDIDFSTIVENCLATSPSGPTAVGQTCKSFYDAGGVDQLAAVISATAPKVAAVITGIRARAASDAKIFVMGYPALLPATGTGCWPQMPLTTTDVPYLRQVALELNGMLRSVATANGATYVDTYTSSLPFNACTPAATRYVEPLIPGNAAAPVHPNARGMAHDAALLEAAMQKAGVS
jgi:hypothetical protein